MFGPGGSRRRREVRGGSVRECERVARRDRDARHRQARDGRPAPHCAARRAEQRTEYGGGHREEQSDRREIGPLARRLREYRGALQVGRHREGEEKRTADRGAELDGSLGRGAPLDPENRDRGQRGEREALNRVREEARDRLERDPEREQRPARRPAHTSSAAAASSASAATSSG